VHPRACTGENLVEHRQLLLPRHVREELKRETSDIATGILKSSSRVQGCSKIWDGRRLIDRFSYEFSPGERLGIVGPNAAGKSTLLNMLAGITAPDEGSRVLGDTSVVGYFTQHPPPVNPKLRIIDYITSIVTNVYGPENCFVFWCA
jgi:ABC transport system ATP-binding/permease protein